MPEWRDVHPSVAPPSAVPGTMFAALYGQLDPHPWPRRDPDNDVFSLFVARSYAMGWMREDSGLWEMNDAGTEHPGEDADRRGNLVAWFQVEVNPLASSQPLPVVPFLRCAYDVVGRFGDLQVDQVVLLLPTQRLNLQPRGPVTSDRTHGWFADSDPANQAEVELALMVGEPASRRTLTHAVSEFVARHTQILVNPYRAARTPAPSLLFDDTFWGGPAADSEALGGVLIEWGPDAIGELAQVLADYVSGSGVEKPTLLLLSRLSSATLRD